ncbi:hypothetical protein A2W24_04210 [Microgenomates group bacterium RBG_16_45_19]|nr:MAG: hypothetical protein A2W24_04210 [Microgenomates group bacterium RBG_16_45_19]
MRQTLKHWFIPHLTNNHRPKVLHPSGLTGLIVIFLIFNLGLQGLKYGLAADPRGLILGFASSILPDQIVEQTNSQRAQDGLAPLKLNEELTSAAVAKANHMFAHNYWAHVAPDGTTPWVFIKNAGYAYSVAGENLARDFGDTGSMIEAWMNSTTHRDNIINPKYGQIGVAVVDGILEGAETTLVVQMFGSPISQIPSTTPLAAVVTSAPVSSPAAVMLKVTPTPWPTVNLIAALQPHNLIRQTAAGLPGNFKVAASPLKIIKSAGGLILVILVLVIIYDEYHSRKNHLTRSVGKNWAHLALFAVTLFLLIFISSGQVPQFDHQVNTTSQEANVN